jgi:hypothetical protein
MDFTTNETVHNLANHTNNNNSSKDKVEQDGDTKPIENKMESIAVNDMTSKDYYFDSYAHFGIHEVKNKNCHLLFLLGNFNGSNFFLRKC